MTIGSGASVTVNQNQSLTVNGTLTNNVTETVTNNIENSVDAGAEFRNVFGIGTEVSFKAFKQWGNDAKPRRHVLEPYANYTFVAEPDVLPQNIYEFDSIDSINEYHQIRIGARNKLQKKVRRKIGYSPHDILDVGRTEHKKLDMNNSEVNLVDLIKRCSDIFAFMAEATSTHIITQIQPNCPTWITSDENRLS